MTLVCSECGEEKAVAEFYKRPDRPRGYKSACKACGRAYECAYRASDKGKEAQRRFKESGGRQASRRRYKQSAKGKASARKYRQSEKGKAARRRHWVTWCRSPKGKRWLATWPRTRNGHASRLRATRKYNASEHGKVTQRRYGQSVGGKRLNRESAQRHRKTKAYKQWLARYAGSPQDKAARAAWGRTAKGRASRARGNARRATRVGGVVNDLTAAEWKKILETHKHCCAYCGRTFTKRLPATRDHTVPVSAGGGLTKNNVVPACGPCNSSKGTKVAAG